MSSADHRLPLPGGDFWVWRTMCLRGTGFPASQVLRLAAPDAAAAADRYLDAQDLSERARGDALAALRRIGADDPRVARARKQLLRARPVASSDGPAAGELAKAVAAWEDCAETERALRGALETAGAGVARAIRDAAADPRLREAVTWQNRAALDSAFAPVLRRSAGDPRTSGDRRHDALVARYLQRYCTKNDSIGFFGPVGWAAWTGEGPAIDLRPGPDLLSSRAVYFEQWAIDAVADLLSRDARLRPWIVPRRLPFVRLDGATAHSAASGKHELGDAEARLVRAADGSKTARELAAALAGTFADEASLVEALAALAEKKLVTVAFELPLGWAPESSLRRLLERIDDLELRGKAARPLDALEAARRGVEGAAGDPERVYLALSDLETTFTEVTGAAATRQAGAMYAGRQLVFEDCRRAVDLTLGPDLLAALGPALSLVLTSARWLTFEVARGYRQSLRALYDDLARRSGTGTVRFSDFWLRSQRVLFGTKDSPLERATAELQERWTRILDAPEEARRVSHRSEELRARVEEAFAAPGPGWRGARHHSPDVMIAAAGAEAIARGEYAFVLGELHPGVNALDTAALIAQHPRPDELRAAFAADLPEPRIVSPPPKDWPGNTVRTSSPLLTPETFIVETGFDPVSTTRDRVLALTELTLEDRDGMLVVAGGSLSPIEVIEFLGTILSAIVTPAFRLLPKRSHTPRVTIDRLIVAREAWTFAPEELAFAFEKDALARFAGARRWARGVGVPRFFFVKSPLEVKPVYVDLASPLFVEMLAKIARAASDHPGEETSLVIAEMTPALDEVWLTDASGERYTSELRLVVVDPGSRE